MKKFSKDKNNISQKIKYDVGNKSLNFPSLEIVMKKEINAYEFNKKNPIYPKYKISPIINNYSTYINTLNANYTTTYEKATKLKKFKSTCLTKKNKNSLLFRKISNLTNRNLTEKINKTKILKKNKSQYPTTVNLLNLGINNDLYNGKNINNYQLANESFTIINTNNKNINNFKRSVKENESINKKIFVKKMKYLI